MTLQVYGEAIARMIEAVTQNESGELKICLISVMLNLSWLAAEWENVELKFQREA